MDITSYEERSDPESLRMERTEKDHTFIWRQRARTPPPPPPPPPPPSSSTAAATATAVLLLRKNAGENRACAEQTSGQGHFRTGPLPITWLCHFRSKGPTRALLRNFRLRMRKTYFRTCTWLVSLPVTWLTSLPVTSLPVMLLPVAPPQMWLELYPYTTNIQGNNQLRFSAWIFNNKPIYT